MSPDEISVHYFLRSYSRLNREFLSKISKDPDVSMLQNDHLVDILMYGSIVFNSISNDSIINGTIQFLRKSGRFKKLEAFYWTILSSSRRCFPTIMSLSSFA